jgi:magnesium-transporting ATPase (P-type)
MVLTALPLMVKGIFEKDLRVPSRGQVLQSGSDIMAKIRNQVPKVYETGRLNKIFTKSAFVMWVLYGVFHSVIIFFIPLYAGSRSVLDGSGRNSDFTVFSTTSFSCIIFVVNLKLALSTRLWNVYHGVSMILLSIFLYFAFVLVYDIMTGSIFRQSIFAILHSFYFYLCVFVSVCLVLAFDGAFLILQKIIVPKRSEVLLEESIRDDSIERKILNSSSN